MKAGRWRAPHPHGCQQDPDRYPHRVGASGGSLPGPPAGPPTPPTRPRAAAAPSTRGQAAAQAQSATQRALPAGAQEPPGPRTNAARGPSVHPTTPPGPPLKGPPSRARCPRRPHGPAVAADESAAALLAIRLGKHPNGWPRTGPTPSYGRRKAIEAWQCGPVCTVDCSSTCPFASGADRVVRGSFGVGRPFWKYSSGGVSAARLGDGHESLTRPARNASTDAGAAAEPGCRATTPG